LREVARISGQKIVSAPIFCLQNSSEKIGNGLADLIGVSYPAIVDDQFSGAPVNPRMTTPAKAAKKNA
jgi:hypothetical protein